MIDPLCRQADKQSSSCELYDASFHFFKNVRILLKSNNVRLNPPNYVVFSKFIYFTEIYTFYFIYIVYTQFIYSLSALYPSENREVFNMKDADFEEEMIDM